MPNPFAALGPQSDDEDEGVQQAPAKVKENNERTPVHPAGNRTGSATGTSRKQFLNINECKQRE